MDQAVENLVLFAFNHIDERAGIGHLDQGKTVIAQHIPYLPKPTGSARCSITSMQATIKTLAVKDPGPEQVHSDRVAVAQGYCRGIGIGFDAGRFKAESRRLRVPCRPNSRFQDMTSEAAPRA